MPTANLLPDGDTTTDWGKTLPNVPETHFTKVDEGTLAAEDSDFVQSDKIDEVDQYTLTASPGDVSTVTQIDVNWRGRIVDPSGQRAVQLDLFHTGSTPVTGNPKYVTVQDLGGSGVIATIQKSWTGLSLTKAQADSLEIRKTHLSKVG